MGYITFEEKEVPFLENRNSKFFLHFLHCPFLSPEYRMIIYGVDVLNSLLNGSSNQNVAIPEENFFSLSNQITDAQNF